MTEYRLPADAVKKLAEPYQWVWGPVGFLVPLVSNSRWSFLYAFLLVLPILVTNAAQERFKALRIRLTEDRIGSISEYTRQSIFVRLNDIVRIEEKPGKKLVIHSSTGRHVDVPYQIMGYWDIRAELAKWKPIDYVKS
jgi:hypothetical protein